MAEIERKLGEQGWTAADKPTTAKAKQRLTQEDREFMVMHPDDVRTGALLIREGDLDKAAALYRRCLATSRRLAKNKADTDARNTFDQALDGLVEIAGRLLQQRSHGQASEIIQELIATSPELLKVQLVRALAFMLGGEGREAHAIFVQHRGKIVGENTWEASVLAAFVTLRQSGHSHALMDEVEKLFGKQPVATTMPETPLAPSPDPLAHLVEADDVQSGNTLFEHRRFDEALAVYRRHLQGWYIRRSRNQINQGSITNRNAAVERIIDLATLKILDREYNVALQIAEGALDAMPGDTKAKICVAHAQMFLGRVEEARAGYLACRGKRANAEQSGASIIARDFTAFREAELTHALMDEIETLLAR